LNVATLGKQLHRRFPQASQTSAMRAVVYTNARQTNETSQYESGFRYPAFAFLSGLRYRPLGAKLCELCSGRFG
jgi:hypothetical protein